MTDWLKLIYFVPETHLETTKTAVFEAGAGQQGDYEHCAWQCTGQGQFRPNANASPYLGQAGELEQVSEYRVETLLTREKGKQVIAALRDSHPYEEPAYELIALVDPSTL